MTGYTKTMLTEAQSDLLGEQEGTLGDAAALHVSTRRQQALSICLGIQTH